MAASQPQPLTLLSSHLSSQIITVHMDDPGDQRSLAEAEQPPRLIPQGLQDTHGLVCVPSEAEGEAKNLS